MDVSFSALNNALWTFIILRKLHDLEKSDFQVIVGSSIHQSDTAEATE